MSDGTSRLSTLANMASPRAQKRSRRGITQELVAQSNDLEKTEQTRQALVRQFKEILKNVTG